MRLSSIALAAMECGVSLTPFQAKLMLGGFVSFLVLLLAGWAFSTYWYRRLGYPPAPGWRSGISLDDTFDVVRRKLDAAFQDGFELKHRDDCSIVIEKTFADPPCVMTARYHRGGHLSWQEFSVVCVGRRWLNWRQTSGGHRWNIGRRGKSTKAGIPQSADHQDR